MSTKESVFILQITNPDTIHHLTDYHDKHIDTITKANYPLVMHMIGAMNATIEFKETDTWGYQNRNGSWNGMIGMLARREIDIGGTTTFFTKERLGVVQYISLYTSSRTGFIFRRPPLSFVSNIFTLPFHRSVWMAITGFLILVFGALYVALRWEWKQTFSEEVNESYRFGGLFPSSWSDNLLIIVGVVSQQGCWYEPRILSARIILLMLLIAVLSLYTSYTAKIVAILQSTTDSIITLKDLLDSPLKLGAHDTVYNRHYFKTFQDPVRKAIYEEKIAPKGRKSSWLTMEEGINRIRQGLFAFHIEFGPGYMVVQDTFQEDEKCGFQEMDYMNVIYPLLAVQYQSPYLEIIKIQAFKVRENGLQQREMSRLYTKRPECHDNMSFLSVSLIESYGAFVALSAGLLLSVAILILEILWQKRQNLIERTSRKWNNALKDF
ncbi:glutamate receptor ionotropic, delta-2 [Orussus abietinus]|uniref:glutamate receptor ionotropic, delta-2 n=1 Tax=Orussus abietinus TaxID=222816 RepID=UPI0006250A98|nr:glutamate receptor ionotropic, delta-2 [Orussus abietinus]